MNDLSKMTNEDFRRALWSMAVGVLSMAGASWERKKVDWYLWAAFDVNARWEPDDYVEEAIAADSTRYDADDVLNALFGVWRLIYDGGNWDAQMVRRWVQRSLHLPSYKMNPDGSRKDDFNYGGDAIASIDAGVDDMPG